MKVQTFPGSRITFICIAGAGLLGLTAEGGQPAGFSTAVKPYAISISPEYVVKPILSVGDRVPLASNPSKQFQMIGVPDGLGAYKTSGGGAVVFMNHEVAATASSEPIVGDARYKGAFVSKFTLNADAEVLCGELGYDSIIDTAKGVE